MIYDALVIGAGPGGSTAARLLAEAGWRVALVEKGEFPRRKVCGEFISATSLPLLDIPTVGAQFFAEAGPEIKRVALFAGKTSADALMPVIRGPGRAWGRALGREHIDTLLRDAALVAGAELFQPFKLAGLERKAHVHVAQIEGGGGAREIEARIVVAANGSWERGALAPPSQPHKPSDFLAFKAHFLDADMPDDLMPLLMFPGGYGGMVHTDRDRLSLSCCIRRDRLEIVRRAFPGLTAGDAVVAYIRYHCNGVSDALRPARLAGPMLSAGPIRPGIRKAYSGGVFRVGNAAGEAHPVIAEGISMAMQSAWLLCRRLIAEQGANADDLAGQAYARDWTRFFAPRIHAANVFAAIAARPAMTTLAAGVVNYAPQVLTLGARLSGKTVLTCLPEFAA